MNEERIYHPNNEDAEWLKLREKNINSSEVASVFGRGEYMTKRKLWELKAGNLEDDFQENIRTKAGQLLEPGIAQLGAWQLGFKARPFKQYIEIPELKMGSSFDWEIYEWDASLRDFDHDFATDGPILLEIKNKDYFAIFGRESHWVADDKTDVIAPPGIEMQMQFQLDLAERKRSMLLTLCAGNELLFGHRQRNEKLISAMRSGVNDFWKSIDNNDAPDPDYERDHDTLKSVFAARGPVGSVAQDDQSRASELIELALGAKQKRLAADKDEKEAKAELMDIMGGHTDLTLDDGARLKWAPNKRGTMLWNIKAAPAEVAA